MTKSPHARRGGPSHNRINGTLTHERQCLPLQKILQFAAVALQPTGDTSNVPSRRGRQASRRESVSRSAEGRTTLRISTPRGPGQPSRLQAGNIAIGACKALSGAPVQIPEHSHAPHRKQPPRAIPAGFLLPVPPTTTLHRYRVRATRFLNQAAALHHLSRMDTDRCCPRRSSHGERRQSVCDAPRRPNAGLPSQLPSSVLAAPDAVGQRGARRRRGPSDPRT